MSFVVMTTLTRPFGTLQLLSSTRTTTAATATNKRIVNNIFFHQRKIISNTRYRSFSSVTASSHHDKQNNRLYICLSSSDDGEHQIPSRVITPLSTNMLNEFKDQNENNDDDDDDEASPERLSEIIDRHYYDSESFVGGMGEGDGGVWFVPHPLSPLRVEPLLSWQMIRDTIRITKDHRHGVPFGVYTSGLGHLFGDKEGDGVELASRLKDDVGLSSCEVSLGAAYDPPSYRRFMYHATGSDDDAADAMRCFGSVCQFIVAASESGFPIGVGVVDGGSGMMARELALSLGAVTAVSYPDLEG